MRCLRRPSVPHFRRDANQRGGWPQGAGWDVIQHLIDNTDFFDQEPGQTVNEEILSINDEARELNFTNEIGYGNTTRFLKNISGLWLVQECRRRWALEEQPRGSRRLDPAAPSWQAAISPWPGSSRWASAW